MRAVIVLGAMLAGLAMPAWPSTFFPVQKTCPVGGETFSFMELGSISTYGQMPDGMPIGSGIFPTAFPQCPKNGLAMYRDFKPAEVARLQKIVVTPAYQALRDTDTPYYRAYHLAKALGDTKAMPWLLLSATWEAKGPYAMTLNPRALRYDEEFVALVAAAPADAHSLESIAMRLRAANALRELGRFDAAETLRASIVIAPDAADERERTGWAKMVAALAAPIARRDATRAPIDLTNDREGAARCISPERKDALKGPPLTAFETEWCKRPALAVAIAEQRKWME